MKDRSLLYAIICLAPVVIPSQYGIYSIPTMWLLDKNGMLADTNGRDGLEEKVAKLLAQLVSLTDKCRAGRG